MILRRSIGLGLGVVPHSLDELDAMEKEALAKLQKKMQKRDVIKPEATISASFAGVCDLTVTRERLAKVKAVGVVSPESSPST